MKDLNFCGNVVTWCQHYSAGTCKNKDYCPNKIKSGLFGIEDKAQALTTLLIYNGQILENQEKILRKLNELQK